MTGVTESYRLPRLREVPPWVKGQPVTQAIADLLRRHREETAELESIIGELAGELERLAVDVALAVHKKQGGKPQDYRLLWDALAGHAISVVTHVGEPFLGDLQELADVVDWVEAADGIAPGCVAEAFEPEVRVAGRLVHRAKLVCVLDAEDLRPTPPGAPPDGAASSDLDPPPATGLAAPSANPDRQASAPPAAHLGCPLDEAEAANTPDDPVPPPPAVLRARPASTTKRRSHSQRRRRKQR